MTGKATYEAACARIRRQLVEQRMTRSLVVGTGKGGAGYARAMQPARDAELYMIASRLKRMVLETILWVDEGPDEPESRGHFDAILSISAELEPMLENLIGQEAPDGPPEA